MPKQLFEDQVQQLMEDFTEEPGEMVWHNIEAAIKNKKSKRGFVFWWLITAVMLSGIGFATYNLFNSKNVFAKADDQRGNKTIVKEITKQPTITKNDDKESKVNAENIIVTANMIRTKNIAHNIIITKKNKKANNIAPSETLNSIIYKPVNNFIPNTKKPIVATVIISTNKLDSTPIQVITTALKTTDSLTTKLIPAVVATITDKKSNTNKWKLSIALSAGVVKEKSKDAEQQSNNSFYAPVTNTPGSGGLTNAIISYKNEAGLAYAAGFTGERNINKLLNFETGLLYNRHITKQLVTTPGNITNSSTQYNNFTQTTTYNYISIPVVLKANILTKNKFKIQLNAGINNLYVLSASAAVKNNTGNFNQRTSITTKLNRYQPSLQYGVTISFKRFSITPQLQNGLSGLNNKKQKFNAAMLGINYYFTK